MERKEAIRSAYRLTGGNNFYDGMITCSTLSGKSGVPPGLGYESGRMRCLSGKCVVRYPGTFLRQTAGGAGGNRNFDHAALQDAAGSGYYLSGLLGRYDGAGTGKGESTAPEKCNLSAGGDVGTLPFTDGEFDIVLSLNGFHAFPDKEAAYREVFRVLRPGGTFCGCFYVADEHKRTDWFVRHIYEKGGIFHTAL